MSAQRCYLDYNATAPLRASARAAVVAAVGLTGNPSSVHAEGREARRLIEDARSAVGALLGAAPDRVVFTSGATEAANLVLAPELSSTLSPQGTRRLLVGATEHAAILQGHRFPGDAVTILPVRSDGTIDLAILAEELRQDGGSPSLLALQAANNETGVIQPVRAAADLVHAAGGIVVCDAVQMAGRLPISLDEVGADAALVSSHKLGGPQGAGAVVLAGGVTLGPALIRGGGQERGFRSGTENVAAQAGFGAAAVEARALEADRLHDLRDRLETGLTSLAPDATIFGATNTRLPNTTAFAVPGTAAETLLIALDLAGVAVSSGSACSSGKVARSHVLQAMGVPTSLVSGALRVSTGWATTEADIDRFLQAYADALRRMRKRPLPAAA